MRWIATHIFISITDAQCRAFDEIQIKIGGKFNPSAFEKLDITGSKSK